MVGRFWIGNFDIKASKLLLFEAFHNWKMASISEEFWFYLNEKLCFNMNF